LIVGCKNDVEDVLRAAIALKRDPSITLVFGRNKEEVKAKLHQYSDAKAMASDLVPHVPASVKLRLREKPPRVCSRSLPSLHGYIAFSLRHKHCVPGELVRLLARYYPDIGQVLARKDELSLKYFRMHMEVLRENERLKAHTRPQPAGGLMYVEIRPEHDVVDLYLEWMARRVSDRASVVKAHDIFYLVNANYLGHNKWVKEISADEARRLTGDMSAEDRSRWEMYYDSQLIESRRNKALAKKMLPAKYAYISPDVQLERYKIEHGIPKHNLDDFFKTIK
jgi:hypothetical protein